jgi:hypothetical protein
MSVVFSFLLCFVFTVAIAGFAAAIIAVLLLRLPLQLLLLLVLYGRCLLLLSDAFFALFSVLFLCSCCVNQWSCQVVAQ